MNWAKKIKLISLIFIFSVFSTQAHANKWTGALEGFKSLFSRSAKEGTNADNAVTRGSKKADDTSSSARGAKSSADDVAHEMAQHQDKFVFEDVLSKAQGRTGIEMDEKFLMQVVQGLMGTRKASRTLVAPAGQGKSTAIAGIQHLIDIKDPVVKPLWGKQLVFFSANDLKGGTSLQGAFEGRIAQMLKYVQDPENSNVILVIDELENLFKDSKEGNLGLKLLDELKTYMAGDMNVKFLFNITNDAYFKHLTDGQHIRRMPAIFLKAPSDGTLMRILRNNARFTDNTQGVAFSEDQLRKILDISKHHPTLGNPDVAVTILENAATKAAYDSQVMDGRVVTLRSKIKDLDSDIIEIEEGRKKDILKYWGPHYERKLKEAKDKKIPLEAVVKDYEMGLRQTEELRSQLGERIQERARLYHQIETNKLNDNLGGEEALLIDELSDEILDLADQIKQVNPLLISGKVSDRHILSAASEYLNLNQGYIERLIGQGASVEATAQRIAQEVRNTNLEGISSIVTRERSLRASGQKANVPGFLILAQGEIKEADTIVEAVVKDLTDTNAYKVNVSTIDSPWAMSQIRGSDAGTINSDIEGAIFQHARKTYGNMGILLSGVDSAISDVLDLAKDIIKNKSLVNNKTSENVSFAKSTVFLTAKLDNNLSAEELQVLKSLRTETDRQTFLRRFVQENYQGKAGRNGGAAAKMDDELLESLHIVVLDNVNVSDSILRAKLGETLIDTISTQLSQKYNITFDFTEGALDYLYATLKASGSSRVDDVVDYEITRKLQKLIEQKNIISGDSVIININDNNQFIVVKRRWTRNGVDHRNGARQQILQEQSMSDILDEAVKLTE